MGKKLATWLVLASLPVLAAGCVQSAMDLESRGSQPIPAKLMGQMNAKGMSPKAPVLVRIFKEESELEVWKRDKTGRYALLKTYPMCRWSGKLGPKVKSGDRQAPEGFYQVAASQLNPNSQFHLSFNLGFPNKLEAAMGHTGEALMVHGACSSSGCYAMTDDAMAEIYPVVREALENGQSSFQVQAFPFRMTSRNMARFHADPNYAFWSNLKQGYDYFEVTRTPPVVSYCGKGYQFSGNAADAGQGNPLAACSAPAEPLNAQVVAKTQSDLSAANTLAASMPAIGANAYSDGGMHPSFRKLLEKSGDDALSKMTSRKKVPISRPAAALADPYKAQ